MLGEFSLNVKQQSKKKNNNNLKYDILEESGNKKFGHLNEKVDLLLSRSLSAPQRC